jgi:hypothetical protein
MSRYTVSIHPTGCKIIEGASIPVQDFAALVTAWAKDAEHDDDVFCSTDLPAILTKRSASNVVAVVGRRTQLEALQATLTP